MQKDILAQLNIHPGVTEVTLVVFDVELSLTNKHSGGEERRTFEDPYAVNVRCRREVKAFCQKLQQRGDVIFAFATHGNNLERVEETARAIGIIQELLCIKLGYSTKGKNRHIKQLLKIYRDILKEYNITITRVILMDDDQQNIDFLRMGDDKYIKVNPEDHSNNLNVTLEAVKVEPPKLEIIRQGKFKLTRSELDPELGKHVYIETAESKAKYLEKLATIEELVKPQVKVVAKSSPRFDFSDRKFLSKSCGSELLRSSSSENDFEQLFIPMSASQ